MTFLDFFAGVGGFRKGMELAGHKCVGFCEFDKFAVASYTAMYLITEEQRQKLAGMSLKERQKEILKDEYRNGEWYSPDIRQVGAGDVPKADCWCFGAPCQDFSVAGKRAGLDGDRSSLVREVFRILRETRKEDRPQWIIYENVKGMLSSNRGFDYLAILLEMDELGYDVEWQLFNSKYYVPQNRERVYVVGCLRTRGGRKIFPLQRTDGEDSVSVNRIGQRNRPGRDNLNQYRVYDVEGLSPCLNKMDGGGREPHIPVPFGIDYNVGGQERDIANTIKARYNSGVSNFRQNGTAVAIPVEPFIYDDYNQRFRTDNLACTLTQNCGSKTERTGQKVAIPVLTPERPEKRQNGRRFKDNGEPSFTLTSQDRHGVAIEVKEAAKQGYAVAHEGDSINLAVPGSATRRGRVGSQIANTLDTSCNQGIFVQISDGLTVYAVWYEKYQCYIAMRKLTPKECFRLQGWTDDYFEKARFVNSDAQLYKQAGNGVTVNVVYEIGNAIYRVMTEEERE